MTYSLSIHVLFGVCLGIFAGVFFGPYCSILQPVASIFTMLLQMVVLPYLSCSLIHGLGSMAPATAKRLLKSGWPFFVLLWTILFFLVFLLCYLIPGPHGVLTAPTGASNTLIDPLLQTIIPQNPFYDLTNNFLPAVVVFSLIVGIALMHLEQKEPFCGFLERLVQAFEKIFKWLAAISPIGVFAHIAIGVGNVQYEDLMKINFYLITFILVSLFITFGVLPLILTSLTKLRACDVFHAYRSVCLLPFLTGLPTLAIPFLSSYLKTEKRVDLSSGKTTEAILPVTFAFGEIGNGLILYFIFFLSFYYRHPLTQGEEWAILFMALPLSLGTPATTYSSVPFLVNQFHFPAGATELYMQTATITVNFQTLTSVAAILTLMILTTAAFKGTLRIQWKSFNFRLLPTLACVALLAILFKPFVVFKDHYQDLYGNLTIEEVIKTPVASEILSAEQGTVREPSERPLRQILASGVLKVGFSREAVPYSYFNKKDQLVGYDIAYAYQLARDLDCRIEFIPADFDHLAEQLDVGAYDIGMSAFLMTEDRLASMDFSHQYDVQHNVLVVPTAKKQQFMHLAMVEENPNLTLLAGGAFIELGRRHFPLAKIIASPSMAPLLAGEADALLWNHSSAFVWCLSHPEFIAIDYGGSLGKSFLAYIMRSGSLPLQNFVDEWLLLKQQSGFQQKMVDYWIDGKPATQHLRWSIWKNVLHQ